MITALRQSRILHRRVNQLRGSPYPRDSVAAEPAPYGNSENAGNAELHLNLPSPADSTDSLPRVHQGSVSCASFYLFFSGTFLLTMAGTLLSTGAWCFLVRLPMIHLAHEPSRIIAVLSGYIIAAGALTMPASCILYREHNVTPGRRSLLPVRSFEQQ